MVRRLFICLTILTAVPVLAGRSTPDSMGRKLTRRQKMRLPAVCEDQLVECLKEALVEKEPVRGQRIKECNEEAHRCQERTPSPMVVSDDDE